MNVRSKEKWEPERISLGVCYYPEMWDKSWWRQDLLTMLEHHISVIRVAEFTWTMFEPREGEYDFSFFDEFLNVCRDTGMQVIFCTPTAIPPIWATQDYPEILNADPNGVLYRHGFRRHCNYSSPKYYELSHRLVEQLARHYCPHPSIIGWQIDNEFNCENNLYHSEADHEAFRRYMQEKYVTLEALNKALGARFWNQTYTSWAQLYLPRPTVVGTTNPHLLLEEKRFISHQIRRYCRMQADILRRYVRPGCFITHNGMFDHLDYHAMTGESLDFISYDSYPNFAFTGSAGVEGSILSEDITADSTGLLDRKWAKNLALARCVSPTFAVTEQQCGPGGSYGRISQPTPLRGQMRLWALQSVAHGAGLVSFFRWRTCPVGSEMYWHGFYNYSRTPTPRLFELDALGRDIQKLTPVTGTRFYANVALLRDYSNDFDSEQDNWCGPVGRLGESGWIAALQKGHVPFDYLYLTETLTVSELLHYRVLIASKLAILPERTAGLLEEYVRQGGILIVGPRTGYKEEHGHCLSLDMPGYLRPCMGVRVEDFTFVSSLAPGQQILWKEETPKARLADTYPGEKTEELLLDVPLFYDVLQPESAAVEVPAVYVHGDYAGYPAVSVHPCGKGAACYCGASVTEDIAAMLLQHFDLRSPAGDLLELPPECELAVRTDGRTAYLFLLNYKPYEIAVQLKDGMSELLSGKTFSGSILLPKFGVMVFNCPAALLA